ncbi:MAG: hypothetical protein ACRC6V_01875 [Bacteroidales bacterium]
MITDERKSELIADLEYSINRYLDKQGLVSDAISSITNDKEEDKFLESLRYRFSVDRPNTGDK